MPECALHILQVNATDTGGGAERVAWDLLQAYRARGNESWLAVGCKRSDDPGVFQIPNEGCRGRLAQMGFLVSDLLAPLAVKSRRWNRLRMWLTWSGQLGRFALIMRGYEDFDFPGTLKVLDLPGVRPDILHCHNLHGGYFDLRVLPWLSRQVPVVLTMHDAWLLSGHCAHSFGCERWKTGCGQCPHLDIYPAVRQDATAYNWRRKRRIYAESRIYVATPSRWLMDRVDESILAPAAVERRVIPNGVDTNVFRPGDKLAARAELGISSGARVILFAAAGIRQNPFKDYKTMRAAVALVAERLREPDLLFIGLGEDEPAEQIGRAQMVFIPYQKDPAILARYYQAADVYIHAARAESWGLTITEALACGTPVAVTATGGIPEQVKGLKYDGVRFEGSTYESMEATGALAPPGDSEGLAAAILVLLTNEKLRRQLGANAAKDARQRFGLDRQVNDYLNWYGEILVARRLAQSAMSG